MPLGRALLYTGEMPRPAYPGDIIAGGESVNNVLNTNGAGTWTGALIATGNIRRTVVGAGYTDTTDTAQNIIAALGGNVPGANVVPGTSFRLRFQNTIAFALTLAYGRGCKTGVGVVTCAASLVREYLVTVLNATPEVTLSGTFANANAAVTFTLPPNMTAFPLGASDNPQGLLITPGQTITDNTTGGNITAATTVAGVTQGQGGVIGVVMSAVAAGASAAAPGDSLTFSPTITFDGMGTLGL